jgi:hypothetical protein
MKELFSSKQPLLTLELSFCWFISSKDLVNIMIWVWVMTTKWENEVVQTTYFTVVASAKVNSCSTFLAAKS